MKQTYMKPRIIIERFALTQSIAASCTVSGGNTLGTPTNWSKDTCAWKVGSQFLFVDGVSACLEDVAADEKVFGVCYNNPDGAMIFSSF